MALSLLFISLLIIPFATALSCFQGYNYYDNPNNVALSSCVNNEDTCTILVITNSTTNSNASSTYTTQFSCSHGCPNGPMELGKLAYNNDTTLTYVQCCQGEGCNQPNTTTPSLYDCNYYPFAAERQRPCGIEGYNLGYGMKYCTLFNRTLDQFSPLAKDWIKNVRQCLQSSLSNILLSTPSITCPTLKSTAFASHVACYTSPAPNSSVCSLSFSDYLSLLDTIKSSFITDTWATISQMKDVFAKCFLSGVQFDVVLLEFDFVVGDKLTPQIISKFTGFPSEHILVSDYTSVFKESGEETIQCAVIFVSNASSSSSSMVGAKALNDFYLSTFVIDGLSSVRLMVDDKLNLI